MFPQILFQDLIDPTYFFIFGGWKVKNNMTMKT